MKKTGLLKKIWRNPFGRLSGFSLAEIIPGSGLLPWQTIAVYDVWRQEKKAGKSPNIAEYLTIIIPVAIVDIVTIFITLTGVGIILSKAITIPCLGVIWSWRTYKQITGVKTTKLKIKKTKA